MAVRLFKSVEVPATTLQTARHIGIFGDTERRLKRMARRAMIYTKLPEGNRRFLHFLMKIEDQQLVAIHRLDPETNEIIC